MTLLKSVIAVLAPNIPAPVTLTGFADAAEITVGHDTLTLTKAQVIQLFAQILDTFNTEAVAELDNGFCEDCTKPCFNCNRR